MVAAAVLAILLTLAAPPAAPATFHNPLKRNGADPWMTYFDGWYYLTTTTGGDLKMRRARTFAGLTTADDVEVWDDDTPGRNLNFWAAEFHRFDDGSGAMRWYGYYTASGPDDPSHRLFVIESDGDDPRGPYHFKAKLQTDPKDEHYAIDGSPFRTPDGQLYLVWCGRPSRFGQGLFIAKMSDPWTVSGERVALDADGFGCDVVREAPVALQRDGRVFLAYSMCGANSPDYRLGLLVADVATADLTRRELWKQYPKPALARNDAAGVYGPGHCFFFKSPDGAQDWIAFHAKKTTQKTYADRVTRAQPFTWTAAGLPDFGVPLADDVELAEPSGTTARR